jgi:hypothetical protein
MKCTAGTGAIVLVGLLALANQGFEKPARGQAVGFQPVVGSFPSGTTLTVTPAVTADRRYVRMSVNPLFTNLLGFDTYSVPAAVTGGAGMNGAIGGLGGGGGIGGGGAGGAGGGGFRATGLGMPRVAGSGPAIGTGSGSIAGDPFARALDQSNAMRSANPSTSSSVRRDAGARPSPRASRTKAGATKPKGAVVARKTAKKKVRYANTSDPAADAAALDLGAGYFPFGP